MVSGAGMVIFLRVNGGGVGIDRLFGIRMDSDRSIRSSDQSISPSIDPASIDQIEDQSKVDGIGLVMLNQS